MTLSSEQQATLRIAKSFLSTLKTDWEHYLTELKERPERMKALGLGAEFAIGNSKAIHSAWLDYRNMMIEKLGQAIEIGSSLSQPVNAIRKLNVLIRKNDVEALIVIADAIVELDSMID